MQNWLKPSSSSLSKCIVQFCLLNSYVDMLLNRGKQTLFPLISSVTPLSILEPRFSKYHYPMSDTKLIHLKECINETLQKSFICPTTSSASLFTFLANQQDGLYAMYDLLDLYPAFCSRAHGSIPIILNLFFPHNK